jgi:hypothetical protein
VNTLWLVTLVASISLGAVVPRVSGAESAQSSPTAGLTPGDFFVGHWRAHHKRLKKWLANSHKWIEFEGTTVTQTILGGFGNLDTFYAEDTLDGKPIRVRFIWSKITPTSCQREQAYSRDAGVTWETNWIMNFTRITES